MFFPFSESTRVFTRRISTASMPTSCTVPILDHKLVRIYLHYPLVMLVLILTFLWWWSSIVLRKGKHTCTSHPISRFTSYSHVSLLSCIYFFYRLIFYSQVYVKSLIYPMMEGCHEEKNASSKTKWHLGHCCSSFREESSWISEVYIVKLNLDESLARSKARLVAKGYLTCIEWIIRSPSRRLQS